MDTIPSPSSPLLTTQSHGHSSHTVWNLGNLINVSWLLSCWPLHVVCGWTARHLKVGGKREFLQTIPGLDILYRSDLQCSSPLTPIFSSLITLIPIKQKSSLKWTHFHIRATNQRKSCCPSARWEGRKKAITSHPGRKHQRTTQTNRSLFIAAVDEILQGGQLVTYPNPKSLNWLGPHQEVRNYFGVKLNWKIRP